jgi:hypothetical protein
MVLAMGPENKNDCAGEDQHQITGLDGTYIPKVNVKDKVIPVLK